MIGADTMHRLRREWWLGLATASVVVAGCAAALVHPTAQDARWAAVRWPETTLADLQHGRALYVQKCAGCHNLHLPEEFAPEEWAGYVSYMVADAKITPEEQLVITRFLASASARTRDVQSDDAHRPAAR